MMQPLPEKEINKQQKRQLQGDKESKWDVVRNPFCTKVNLMFPFTLRIQLHDLFVTKGKFKALICAKPRTS